MIVFVLEGKAENAVAETVRKCFFPRRQGDILYSYENNIYQLYSQIKKLYGGTEGISDYANIISLLRERHPGSDLDKIERISDVEETFLFFDYDFHHALYALKKDPQADISNIISENNRKIEEMLNFFCEETEMGKLYINYPMLESTYYTKELPDNDFYNYEVNIENSHNFKEIVDRFSFYKGHKGILLQSGTDRETAIDNWKKLIEQNAKKANYIISGQNQLPNDKTSIAQRLIFMAQENKLLKTSCIGILSSFPLFIYEYFKG